MRMVRETWHVSASILKTYCALGALILLSACGGGGGDDSNPDERLGDDLVTDPTALTAPGTSRDWLTKDALLASSYPHQSPIHNATLCQLARSKRHSIISLALSH